MERLDPTQSSYQSDAFTGSRGYQGGRAQYIEDTDMEVRTEAYKVNWCLAAVLLVAGVIPGLIYLGGIALLNCMGGKQVMVPRERTTDHLRVDRAAATTLSPASMIDPRSQQGYGTSGQRRQESRRGVSTPSDPLLRDQKRAKKHSRRTDTSVVGSERRETRTPTDRSRRDEQRVQKDSRRVNRSGVTPSPTQRDPKPRGTQAPTPARTHSVDASVPAPIREARKPRGRDEEKAVIGFMAREVINGSRVDDKERLIRSVEIMAKTSPYEKMTQHLGFYYKPSFEAFMRAHPFLA